MTGLLIGAGMLVFGGAANAAIIVTPGNHNSGTDNVLSNACSGNVTAAALTVQGCLNTDHTAFVNFTGTENLEISGGQASLEAADGAFRYLMIAFDGGQTFSKLVLNIDANANGTVVFTGSPGGDSAAFALNRNGNNFFTITGEDFTSVSFATSVGVADVKQVRIGGILAATATPEPEGPGAPGPNSTAIPEPAMLGLLGMGLIGLLALRQRRRRG